MKEYQLVILFEWYTIAFHWIGLLNNSMGDNLKTIKLGDGFIPNQVSIGAATACVLSTNHVIKC